MYHVSYQIMSNIIILTFTKSACSGIGKINIQYYRVPYYLLISIYDVSQN